MHNRLISVVGLGYVGLPVAVAFGRHKRCIGFDINTQRIQELRQGFDRTLAINTEELAESDILYTSDINDLKLADFHIIAVPTPVDNAHKPDLTSLKKASVSVGVSLKKGDTVVYESTVYPGVTEEICVPILESASGLKCGIDFKVGYSPERINPGDKEHTFSNIKKIVSGQDEESTKLIAEVYASVITAGVCIASSIKVAEAAKVIENTQRDLNIALMNELAVIFDRMEIDTLDVLEVAGTKWNFLPFRPGLVGGHCIGVDPYYLTHKAEILGYIPQVILAGRRINDNMGRYIARRAIKTLIKTGHSIKKLEAIILGVTFKEDCPDTRNSKVIDIANELIDYNVKVFFHDPVAAQDEALLEYGISLTSWDDLPIVDLIILAVGHTQYRDMELARLLKKANPQAVIIDVKSILPKKNIQEQGYTLWRL